jgi:hypothetical protein
LEAAFNQAKAFLKQQQTPSDSNNSVSLYDHLTQVLVRLLQQRPGNAVGKYISFLTLGFETDY